MQLIPLRRPKEGVVLLQYVVRFPVIHNMIKQADGPMKYGTEELGLFIIFTKISSQWV